MLSSTIKSALSTALRHHGLSVVRCGLNDRRYVRSEVYGDTVEVWPVREYEEGTWEIRGDLSSIPSSLLASLGFTPGPDGDLATASARADLHFSRIAGDLLLALSRD